MTFTYQIKSLSYLDPEELWRKLKCLKGLFSRGKELYGSREVAENAIPSGANHLPRNKNHRKSMSVS